jgi:hypothetical protein
MDIMFYLGLGFVCGGTGIALTGLGFADYVSILFGAGFFALGCLLMLVGAPVIA